MDELRLPFAFFDGETPTGTLVMASYGAQSDIVRPLGDGELPAAMNVV